MSDVFNRASTGKKSKQDPSEDEAIDDPLPDSSLGGVGGAFDHVPGKEVGLVGKRERDQKEEGEWQPGQPPRQVPDGALELVIDRKGCDRADVASGDAGGGLVEIVEMSSQLRGTGTVARPLGEPDGEAMLRCHGVAHRAVACPIRLSAAWAAAARR